MLQRVSVLRFGVQHIHRDQKIAWIFHSLFEAGAAMEFGHLLITFKDHPLTLQATERKTETDSSQIPQTLRCSVATSFSVLQLIYINQKSHPDFYKTMRTMYYYSLEQTRRQPSGTVSLLVFFD